MKSGADKLGQVLLQSGVIYYKVGHTSLQSGVDINSWGKYIKKRDNYYKNGAYTFMTLGQMEIHVCLLIRPMRFESGVL